MDPASAISLTGSLIQMIGTITRTLGYLNDIKNAPRARAQLSQEILSLLSLLMSLRDKVEIADPESPWFNRIRCIGLPEGPLEQCKTALDGLDRILNPEMRLKSINKRLIWPLEKKRLSNSLSLIERLKTLISIALQEDNL